MTTLEELESLRKETARLKSEVEHKNWVIKKLNHRIYGSSSERVIVEEEQYIFNEIEVEAPKAEPEQFELVPGYKRKKGRGKKKPFPEDLERDERVLDLSPEEKVCPHDGTELKEIGEEVTEKLKTYPARSVILVERKKKYACPCCSEHMAQAKSNSILPKTIATPELLSFLIFSKFFQGLPLYRIEEFYKLQGIQINRSTMGSWLFKASEKLQPIWNVLEEWALDSGYMAIDATSVQVLKEKEMKPETKTFMWARGSPEKGIVLFDYNRSGGGAIAKELVTGFKGALQADAHKGYTALDRESILLLGCMMHARRRFHKAWLDAGKKPGVAENALKMFKRLYRYEEAYKKRNLSFEERQEARQKEVRPYLDKMLGYCEKNKKKVLKSSPLGNACHYFVNEFDELSAFLNDGRYEIDNGWIERVIKRFAIGRKNWLFADTVDGAKASSVLYSFALTAKLNDKDPFEVMTEIIRRLPKAETIDDYEALAKLLLN